MGTEDLGNTRSLAAISITSKRVGTSFGCHLPAQPVLLVVKGFCSHPASSPAWQGAGLPCSLLEPCCSPLTLGRTRRLSVRAMQRLLGVTRGRGAAPCLLGKADKDEHYPSFLPREGCKLRRSRAVATGHWHCGLQWRRGRVAQVQVVMLASPVDHSSRLMLVVNLCWVLPTSHQTRDDGKKSPLCQFLLLWLQLQGAVIPTRGSWKQSTLPRLYLPSSVPSSRSSCLMSPQAVRWRQAKGQSVPH